MKELIIIILLSVNVLLALTVLFIVLNVLHCLKKELKEVRKENKTWSAVLLSDVEKSLAEIKEDVGVVLDGLVLAQTKDKLGLVHLIKDKRPIKQERIDEIETSAKIEESIREEKLEPIKKEYIPVD